MSLNIKRGLIVASIGALLSFLFSAISYESLRHISLIIFYIGGIEILLYKNKDFFSIHSLGAIVVIILILSEIKEL
jgi:hypothetical protein